MPRGKAIATPEELLDHFEAYKKWVKDNPYLVHDFVGKDAFEVEKRRQRPLTWSGFEAYLYRNGIVSQLTHYERNDREAYTEYLPIISRIKAECRADVIDGALSGVYHANLAARIEGISDKQDQNVKGEIDHNHKITGMEIL